MIIFHLKCISNNASECSSTSSMSGVIKLSNYATQRFLWMYTINSAGLFLLTHIQGN